MSFFQYVLEGNIVAMQDEINRLKLQGRRGLAELHQRLREVNGSGKTLLHVAAETGNLAMVHLLLNQDIPVATLDQDGRKASALAKERAFEEVAALLRTREAWQENARDFRFNKVIGMISDAVEKVRRGADKDKVLLLGRSRIGKSSFINYAQGTKYKQIKVIESDDIYLERIGGVEEIAKTKAGPVSETLYPQTVEIADQQFALCDLAGLVDSRGVEERICAASSTQILTTLPGKIKALAVVLDLPSFKSSAGQFKETLDAMSKILGYNEELLDSLYFIITKAPVGVTFEGIKGSYLQPLMDDLTDPYRDRKLTVEEERLMQLIHFMIEHEDRILIPNVCDDGQSYAAMREVFANANSRPANLFNFNSHDNSQEQFNSVLCTIGREYAARQVRKGVTIPQLIIAEQQKEAAEVANIVRWQAEIALKRLEMAQPYDAQVLDASIAAKSQEIVNNDAEIVNQNAQLLTASAALGRVSGQLNSINNSNHIEITGPQSFARSGTSHRRYLGLFGPLDPDGGDGHHTFSFDASFPISRVETVMENGHMAMLNCPLGQTSLSATYCYPYGHDSSARIVLYTESRHYHAARIQTLQQQQATHQQEVNNANAEVARLQARNAVLRNEVLAAETEKAQGQADVETRNVRLSNEIEQRDAWINGRVAQEAIPAGNGQAAQAPRPAIIGAVQLRDAAIAAQNQLRQEAIDIELELRVNHDLFVTVADVARILQLNHDDLRRLLDDIRPVVPILAGNAERMADHGLFQNRDAGAGQQHHPVAQLNLH